jgi:hypothetical protein
MAFVERLSNTAVSDSCPWVLEFFNFLAVSSSREPSKPFELAVPDTIVYKYSRPMAFYRTELDVVSQHSIYGLTADDLRSRLQQPAARDPDPRRVVAYFVHMEPAGAGVQPKVEYFEESSLRVFLNTRRVPADGILQKFVDGPEERQRLLRVQWTPCAPRQPSPSATPAAPATARARGCTDRRACHQVHLLGRDVREQAHAARHQGAAAAARRDVRRAVAPVGRAQRARLGAHRAADEARAVAEQGVRGSRRGRPAQPRASGRCVGD